ncbi:hypothetical protein Nepgr_019540 [Nepenthes gracilis]|uniref:Uncharacterized protein n=1 Tax=Nepenthes gracilis TaxID=150966 RepID=A0AAD3XV52_NEPGR|nr:hypothetical protein Nepgr_019540 [Nepenthes gracilis]
MSILRRRGKCTHKIKEISSFKALLASSEYIWMNACPILGGKKSEGGAGEKGVEFGLENGKLDLKTKRTLKARESPILGARRDIGWVSRWWRWVIEI